MALSQVPRMSTSTGRLTLRPQNRWPAQGFAVPVFSLVAFILWGVPPMQPLETVALGLALGVSSFFTIYRLFLDEFRVEILSAGHALRWERCAVFWRRQWMLDLRHVERVAIGNEPSDDETPECRVVLDARRGAELHLATGAYLPARRIAEAAARIADVDLVDHRLVGSLRTSSGSLGASYVERIAATARPASAPPHVEPEGWSWSATERGAEIRVPPAGLHRRDVLSAAGWGVVIMTSLIALAWQMLPWDDSPVVRLLLALAVGGGLGLALLVWFVRQEVRCRLRETLVAAGPEGLHVEMREPRTSCEFRLPADALLDLAVAQGGSNPTDDYAWQSLGKRAILARTADGAVAFAHGLELHELTAMIAVLDFHLTGRLRIAPEAGPESPASDADKAAVTGELDPVLYERSVNWPAVRLLAVWCAAILLVGLAIGHWGVRLSVSARGWLEASNV